MRADVFFEARDIVGESIVWSSAERALYWVDIGGKRIHRLEIAGRRFARGEKLGLLYGAANRDPAHFLEPDRFDVGRTPNRHLGFGNGAHFCLGNHVSRMDMEIVFAALLARSRDIALLEPPAWRPGLAARGPLGLKIRLLPA